MKRQENPNPNRRETERVSPPKQTKHPIENHEVDSENETEQALGSIEATSNQSIEAALDTAKMIETSPFPSKRKEQLRGGLKRSLKKIFRIFSFATVLTGAAGMADYTLTRYKVEPRPVASGGINYEHQDPETTHIINVLAGKEQLNDSDKKDILIDYLTDELPSHQREGDYNYINPADLKNKSLGELTEIAEKFVHIENPDGQFIYPEEKLKNIITNPNPEAFDPQLCNALWKLEQECGNPKVRFRLATKKKMFGLYNPGRSFYNSNTNTAFIDISDNEATIDNYIAELSHGRQFDRSPISSNLLYVRDIIKTAKGFLAGDEASADQNNVVGRAERSYNRLYEEPGTLEYDAHNVIQPKLRSELEALTPTRTAKQKENQLYQERIIQQMREEIKKLDEEEKKALDAAFYYYANLVRSEKIGEADKLDKEYSDRAWQIREEFRKKKEAVHKRFEVR
jgi:hypothetical protein